MYKFNSISEIIEDIRNGKMVILVDDENRENEGDLIIAADHANPHSINFMATYGRGLICLAMVREQIQRLGLPLMVKDHLNHSPNKTAFTVSIEAAKGVTTGISAADRSHTIRVASNPNANGDDITVPGHIFPIQAQEGGVLKRAGHTEASVDLAVLAGMNPSAAICEIMNVDGSMARVPELMGFADKFSLKIGTIEDLIEYRIEHDTFVEEVESVPFETEHGSGFTMKVFKNHLDNREHLALIKGNVSLSEPCLVRVHTENVLGDIFAAKGSTTRQSLESSLKMIDKEGRGALVYLCMEDSEQRLIQRVKSYKNPDFDKKDYGVGAQILRSLGIHKLKLLSNSPSRPVGLKGYGLEIVETVRLIENSNPSPQILRPHL
ncbi:MAG: 3,4-dihydroxy-2-butanone-4-phosphate synthase [Bdellovibrionaceae bacterium]|nr:3,4-dihydroxy-2-butanone-4-phosphate synthase [Pseudobdellovibrionaceae bacterium]